ncbi:MAG: hypothetical protein MUC65_08635 [Pontiellaceae bacterium]|jgi:hypothetical protein|nr:hypothetical protein [Pontiellaceae bacterium]
MKRIFIWVLLSVVCASVIHAGQPSVAPPGGGEGFLSGDDISVAGFNFPAGASDADDDIVITGFFPGGECGLFWDNESVQVTISGANTTAVTQDIHITFAVTDYYDNLIGNPVVESFMVSPAPGNSFTRNVNLGMVSNAHGWFCIRATVTQGEHRICQKATGCCVFENVSMSNSFTSANCNGAYDHLLLIPAMQRIGVNSRGIIFKLGYAPQNWRTSGYVTNMLISSAFPSSAFWKSSLEIEGYLLPDRYAFGWPPWRNSETNQYPYSEAYYMEFGDFVEAVATACGSRVKKWVVSEEYEPSFNYAAPGHRQDEVNRYIRQTQIIYDRVKAVNPDCKIVGLTPSSSELYTNYLTTNFWKIARTELLTNGLSGHFDIIGPDAYGDVTYQITASNFNSCMPERSSLREALSATRDLQMSLSNGLSEICISEFGYMVPFHYVEPDNEVTKRVANLLARYILIAKTVPDVSSLSLYAMSAGAAWSVYHHGAVSTDADPLWDYGLWRIDYLTDVDPPVTPYCHPRPWAAAVATINRLLGNASNPVEIPLGADGCYGWRFNRESNTVTVLWTTSQVPRSVVLDLPDCTEYDLMGNPHTLSAGSNTLSISVSNSPVFIVAPQGPSDGPYSIRIVQTDSSHMTLAWPTNALDWGLESTFSLVPADWNTVTGSPVVNGTNFELTILFDFNAQFFRLRRP